MFLVYKYFNDKRKAKKAARSTESAASYRPGRGTNSQTDRHGQPAPPGRFIAPLSYPAYNRGAQTGQGRRE
ncbi:hypothetical protein L226DRAFT_535652 [Lentinus tigrinus ALCF2SS1-7]|uniref:uncharacterized protein n=1 Tax=Lentinus tigrinus ALCF2SS1-7 TaxID=1328758 RepID=UPI0011661E73|nr:hypothetical protein L226DRAFT_535652 [Lentinus tigrinus ALCF2SS1-7]